MVIHEMMLHLSPFLAIKSGQKTVEMRLYDEKRKQINIGDRILFSLRDDPQEQLLTEVVSLSVFDSFASLYGAFPLSCLGYAKEEIDTASPADMEQYYTREQQACFGVVGIGIRLLTPEN